MPEKKMDLEFLEFSQILSGTADCLWRFIRYILPCVFILLLIKFGTKVPKFVFRKLLHLVAFTCVILMLTGARSWICASLASLLIAAVIYPVLALAERNKHYAELFVEKRPGEIKRSLVFLFTMFAVLSAVGWGIFGKPMIAAASILMWGVGDATAALVGIPFGKHKVKLKGTDGKKSWEGSLSMAAISFLCGLVFLLVFAEIPFFSALPLCLAGAIAGSATELYSSSEWDTVTVPFVILIFLLLLG